MSFVTMPDLGPRGRLGNQLFQFSVLYSIMRNGPPGSEIVFVQEQDPRKARDYVLNAFVNVKFRIVASLNVKREFHDDLSKFFETNQDLLKSLNTVSSNEAVKLSGYFQSYRYFDDIRAEILELFRFNSDVVEKCKEFLRSLGSESFNIALHVRRGDVLTGQHLFILLSLNFYERCMRYFLQKKNKKGKLVTFVVFSDDLPWCRENIKPLDDSRVVFSPFSNQIEDLCGMSLCKHNIISASTFSWWGAYLNTNPKKIVLCPRIWFNPNHDLGKCSLSELYLPDWKRIAN